MVKFLNTTLVFPERNPGDTRTHNGGGEEWSVGLGKRLKQTRKEAGLSQLELAQRVGATKGRIAMIETGETKSLKATDALQIADVLRVRPEWLVLRRGPKYPGLPAVDTALLTKILTQLDEALSSSKNKFEPDKRAQFAGYLYERAVADGLSPTDENVKRLVDLAS